MLQLAVLARCFSQMINPFFMFATDIENSIPTITTAGCASMGMEKCGFYINWHKDFSLLEEIGIRFLCYRPPLHRTLLAAERFDWEFADLTMNRLKQLDIVPIVDLCHFGVPDWIGNFQNPDFPRLFERYARAFAQRYPRGSALHPRQRDVRLRHLFRSVRLVERAANDRSHILSPRSSTSSRRISWRRERYWIFGPTRSSFNLKAPNISTPTALRQSVLQRS